jgi:hypothetical protein
MRNAPRLSTAVVQVIYPVEEHPDIEDRQFGRVADFGHPVVDADWRAGCDRDVSDPILSNQVVTLLA